MAEKLVAVFEPAQLQSGIVKSPHVLQSPLWIDGQNVVFEDGAVRKSPGYMAIIAVPGTLPVAGMQDVLVAGTANLCWGDVENLYRYDGEEVTTDGTSYTGSLSREAFQINAFQDDAFQETTSNYANLWSMTDWGSWCLATNWIDDIQINKMAGAGFGSLGGTPPSRARIIIRYKTFVVCFNTDLGGEFAEWCDVDDVEEWAAGAAGNLAIRDLDSEINCVVPLGEVLAVYSNNCMAVFQYIGPDFWFGAKKVLEGIGATGIFSVIPKEGLNFGFSRQGIWKTDGAAYEYISPPYIRQWIQDHVNFGQADKIAGYLNEDRSMLEWGVAIDGASENNITLGYNYDNGAWTFRNFGITCALKKNAFVLPVFGKADGGIYFGEYGLNADTSPLEAWVQSKPLTGKDHMTWKDIEYLVSFIKDLAGTGVVIYLGVQSTLDDAVAWGAAITAKETSDPDFFTPNQYAGKYLSFKIYSNGMDDNWKLAGFDIYGSQTGMHV